MNFNEYQELAQRTVNRELNDTFAMVASGLKLSGEAGEVADHLGKWIGHGHPLDCEKVALELGDCLWYIVDLARRNGYTLEQIATMNIDKLRKRYPEGFSTERSLNRLDTAE